MRNSQAQPATGVVGQEPAQPQTPGTASAVGVLPHDSDAAVDQLFTRWHRDHDLAARDALVERFLPLARNLARRYVRSSEPFEDLMQVASLGLVKALDRFDPSRGFRFAAFAVPTILGELRRYFRDSAWSIHVPRGAQEQSMQVEEAQQHLTNATGRAPTVQQIAQYLEVDMEEVLAGLQVAQAYSTLSLDAPRRSGEDDHEAYGDTLGSDDERYDLVENDVVVSAALRHLAARERRILHLRFVEDLTQSEIAARVGLSQMQISRLLRRSLEQLRRYAEGDESDAAPTGGR